MYMTKLLAAKYGFKSSVVGMQWTWVFDVQGAVTGANCVTGVSAQLMCNAATYLMFGR